MGVAAHSTVALRSRWKARNLPARRADIVTYRSIIGWIAAALLAAIVVLFLLFAIPEEVPSKSV